MIWFLNDPFWSPIASLFIALLLGIARQFYEQIVHPRKKYLVKNQFKKEVFIAFCCGLMGLLLALFMGIAGYGIHLICGIGAWTAPNILTVAARISGKLVTAKDGELTGEKPENKK